MILYIFTWTVEPVQLNLAFTHFYDSTIIIQIVNIFK